MWISFKKLLNDLNGNVIIYGTGCCAKKIYKKLMDIKMHNIVTAFTVSDNLQGEVYGKAVYPISKLRKIYNGETILVAVSNNKYVNEIENVLAEYGYEKVIYLTKYFREDSVEIEEIINIGDNESVGRFIDRWASDNFEPLFCDNESIDYYLQERKRKGKAIKQIVFIAGFESVLPRTVKIMGALQRKGFEPVLLCFGDADGRLVREELTENNLTICQCESAAELMYKMLQFNPLTYCIDILCEEYMWIKLLLSKKNIFGKVIVTAYDVSNDFSTDEKRKQAEKYAFENADGIIWRWFSKEDIEKEMRLPSLNILFPDYCDLYFTPQKADDEKKLKICYVAGTANALIAKEMEDNRWRRYARIEEILMKLGNNNDCQLHLYANYATKENKKRFKLLESKYSNFKVFWSFTHKELIEKLSCYDYGMFLYTGDEVVPDKQRNADGLTRRAFRNSVCNKYIDYIQAGIAVITKGGNMKQLNMLREYNVIVDMDLSDLDIDFLIKNKEYYKESAKKARKELIIDNHIVDLCKFFDAVGGN